LKESRLLVSFFNCNSASYGHTNTWVVAGADEAHHFSMKSACGGFQKRAGTRILLILSVF